MSNTEPTTTIESTEDLIRGAQNLRSEPGFRKIGDPRSEQVRTWDHPDYDDDDAADRQFQIPAGTQLAVIDSAETLPAPLRLINKTAVAIVFVEGVDPEDRISIAEKWNVIAQWAEATEWISGSRPSANISWEVAAYDAIVDMTPWEGAPFPGLNGDYYDGFSAAVNNSADGKIYLFGANVGANSAPPASNFSRISSLAGGFDQGYPQSIASSWTGLGSFASGVDAALWRESNQKIYLFKGAEYVRVDPVTLTIDPNYPKPIADGWLGTADTDFADGIDAALGHKDNNSVYFFKGDEYIKFTNGSSTMTGGYPKPIADHWPGVNESLSRIDAAFWRDSNQRIYFFKNSRWGAKYVRVTPDDFTVESNYIDGKHIGLSKDDAEALWRNPALEQLGYEGSHDGGRQLCADLVAETNSDQGIVIYITKLPVVHHAYANAYRLTVSKPDFSGDFSTLLAHEILHLFGAKDEYKLDSSCTKKYGRFLKTTNSNSKSCDDSPADCIMLNNTPSMCSATPVHVGWGAFETQIDAAVYRGDTGKTYLFSNGWYVRYSDIADGIDEGYPWRISSGFAGLNADFRSGIDAALWREDNQALYMFKGSQYVRFNQGSNAVADGYPMSIGAHWHDLPAEFQDGIEAAFWRDSNDRIYLFKGDEYVRMKVESGQVRAESNYPRPIADSFEGMTSSFNDGISAALMRRDTNQVYFFAGSRYLRFSNISNGMDEDNYYPRFIDKIWMPFPR